MAKIRTTAILALLAAMPAMAQMDNVVDVEHIYKPEIKDANKINIQPEVKAASVERSAVDYALTPRSIGKYTFTPVVAAKSATSEEGQPRRFISLGGGTEGNILGNAALGIKFDQRTALDISLGLRGHNAKVQNTAEYIDQKWDSRFYSTTASAGIEHKLSSGASIFAEGGFESQVFNYQQDLSPVITDKQHNTLAGLTAGITPYSIGKFDIDGSIGYEMFSQKYVTSFSDKCKEGILRANANSSFSLSGSSKIAVGLTLANASYSDGIDGYTNFAVRPHYIWNSENIDIKAGLYAGTLGIAPDISFTYRIKPDFHIYAEVTGGETTANTFRSLTEATPYWALVCNEMKTQFNQLSALGGIRFAPLPGVKVDINGGYEISADRLEFAPANHPYESNICSPAFFADGTRLFINANASYNYKDRIALNLANQFNAWSIDDNSLNAEDALWRPIVDLDWTASFRLAGNLRLGADFRLQTFKEAKGNAYSRPTTTNLGATLSYTLDNMPLTAYIKGNNLLNHKHDAYFGYRAPGINIIAGAAYTF